MPLPPLTTERLLLRQRHLDDVAAIIRMNSDPEIMRFVGDGRMSDPVELEKRTRERVGTDFGVGLGYWSVFPRERPDDYLGYVVLSPVPESTDIELSYGIQRNAWGRGFATEASRAGLEFGFRVRGLPEIVALTYPTIFAPSAWSRSSDSRRPACATPTARTCCSIASPATPTWVQVPESRRSRLSTR